jgi:hypothetical protein
MDLATAFDIVTPPSAERPLGVAHIHHRAQADIMAPFAEAITAACKNGYGLSLHSLDANAATLRSFLRGMVSADIARAHIAKARADLDAMEAALNADVA